MEIERCNKRQDRIIQEVAAAGQHNHRSLQEGNYSFGACNAFTLDLRHIIWPVKFKPDHPPRYDGKNNPLEFLQLYAVEVQAAGRDDKVMDNWFQMGLKDSVLSWFLNLPEGFISSWEGLCKIFVANFKGTYERALTVNDLRAVRQKHEESLHHYIQHFSQVRNKISNLEGSHVINAFREGVTNKRMLKKLSIHDTLSSVATLFDLADKCAKAEEGLLFCKMNPDKHPPESSKTGLL